MGDERAARGIRILRALRKEPDWAAMSDEQLVAYRDAENRTRSARLTRVISGFPDRKAVISWERVVLPEQELRVRVHRPARAVGVALPLVVHVHGGAFVGTAPQSDWINSHLAARLPAVVISVEHRLVGPRTPMLAAVDDGWDVLCEVVRQADRWGVDPGRVAVFGESGGAAVTAMAALRARDDGLPLRAQVLVNPCADLTATALDYPSMREHADAPMLSVPLLEFVRRLAVPEGADARAVSPLVAADLGRLAPALIVVPTLDPLADQGRAYAARLRAAGTPVRLTEHPGATHAFLSMPGVVPQARHARVEIFEFLRDHLAP